MYSETLEKMNKYGMAKVNLLKESKLKYFVASMLAGLYVGLGIILNYDNRRIYKTWRNAV